ncbi:CynX/NimT family MFS transporter [Microbacterium invictum]|uniref:CP family cyanate transporter-like MFS transporter n=1 Tax=Microbacterium invictum TaxID=515415 RepID=A0AA40SRI7_9MICO|nr:MULTISPECIES: MFS transporter [Microbacterium]MBB4140979.1 CP family cyanate transporter-like MFS transporter [Microbacterium invictum]
MATPSRTQPPPPARGTSVALLLVAVCLVAANMRPAITGLGPLIDQIGTDTGMSVGTLGVLAAVPLVAWALFSPVAHTLSRRFGQPRVLLGSLIVLLAGTLVRSLPGVSDGLGEIVCLWIGTAVIGVGIAIINVLMPAIVKREFPARVAVITALYTALLAGFGAVSSGVVVPISHIELGGDPAGWRFALLVTGIGLLPFAIVAWWLAHRGPHHAHTRAPEHRGRTGIWTDPVAWLVAAYMGLQSAMFYMLVTWLATISMATGRSEVLAGVDVMVYQLLSLAGSVSLPFILRGRIERFAPALIPSLAIVGTVGLMLAPGAISVWVVLLGLSSGSTLAMSLTLMAQRARDHDASSALSGMSQSVGYLIAALGPVTFGALHALTDGWIASLSLLLVVLVLLTIVGVFAGRPRFVLDPSR